MAAKGILKIKVLGDAAGLNSTLDSAHGKIAKFGVAVGGAFLAAGAAAATFAFKSAVDIDKAMDTIRIGTGATGDALKDLGGSFKTVFKGVPASAEDVGTAIADLNTRTGLTGKALEDLTKQSVQLAKITKGDLATQIAATTRVFGDWSIASEDQSKAMDYLFKVSQQTGIGVADLSQKVVQFGAPLRQLGFDFETSAALMGKWEKECVNLETVLAGMKIGLANFAKAGEEPKEALIRMTEAIKNAGSQAEANKLAIEVFGQRAGPDMAAAIREGRFELDDLLATLDGSTETINKAAEDTYDFGEKWVMFKNKLATVFEPLGTKLMDILGKLIDWVSQYVPHMEALFASFFGYLSGEGTETTNKALQAVMDYLGRFKDLWDIVWPAIKDIVQMFVDWLSGPEGQQLIESVFTIVTEALNALKAVFDAVWPAVKAIVKTFIDFWAGEKGQKLITNLLGLVVTAVELVQEVFEAVWPAVETLVQTFADFLSQPAIQEVLVTLFEVVADVVNAVLEAFEAVWPALGPLVSAAAAVIKPIIDAMMIPIRGLIAAIETLQRLWAWFKGSQQAISDAGAKAAADLNMSKSAADAVLAGSPGMRDYYLSKDVGGPIPGAPGQPIPILAHGGEYMLTRGDMTELGKMLAGGMKGSRGLVVNIYGMAHDTAETLSGRVMFDLARVGAI